MAVRGTHMRQLIRAARPDIKGKPSALERELGRSNGYVSATLGAPDLPELPKMREIADVLHVAHADVVFAYLADRGLWTPGAGLSPAQMARMRSMLSDEEQAEITSLIEALLTAYIDRRARHGA